MTPKRKVKHANKRGIPRASAEEVRKIVKEELAAFFPAPIVTDHSRPIETAPRDGSYFLVEAKSVSGFAIVRWAAVQAGCYGAPGYWQLASGTDAIMYPKRWWPLPTASSIEQGVSAATFNGFPMDHLPRTTDHLPSGYSVEFLWDNDEVTIARWDGFKWVNMNGFTAFNPLAPPKSWRLIQSEKKVA